MFGSVSVPMILLGSTLYLPLELASFVRVQLA